MTEAWWFMTSGAFLQFVGVAIVFWDIAETEQRLRLTPWIGELWSWLSGPVRGILRRFRRVEGRTVELRADASGSASASGQVRLSVERSRGTTVQQRLASLQLQVDDQRRELDAQGRELDDLASQLSMHRNDLQQALAEAEHRSKAELARLNDLITGLSAGSIRWRVAGGVIILLGTALILVAQFVP